MSLASVTNQRERDKFVETSSGDTGIRVVPDLASGASSSEKQEEIKERLDDVISQITIPNSLVPGAYDYVSLSYTGSNVTTVVYKLGGSGGTVVSTLTLGYDGSDNLTSVTKA